MIDNMYGENASGGWRSQGGDAFSQSVDAYYAEFSLEDKRDSTTIDFKTDYRSGDSQAAAGLRFAAIHN